MKNIIVKPDWKKTKEEIWSENFENLTYSVMPTRKRLVMVYLYPVAAAILILIIVSGLYTKTITSDSGERVSFTFSDGSKVVLNSESSIRYKPYLWFFTRSTELMGEAYFEVVKGNEFKVRTNYVTVSVLGTSFNVMARNETLSVTCYTGKIALLSERSNKSITIGKNTRMTYNIIDDIFTTNISESYNVNNSWTENRFFFVSEDLLNVFKEIERQYNIKIQTLEKQGLFYTGNFQKPEDPYEVLKIVTAPFDLMVTFEDNVFTIK